jgi:hypothetical protein
MKRFYNLITKRTSRLQFRFLLPIRFHTGQDSIRLRRNKQVNTVQGSEWSVSSEIISLPTLFREVAVVAQIVGPLNLQG